MNADQLQVADVLEWILEQVGKSEVWQIITPRCCWFRLTAGL
jgi:hypothetical protein